MKNQCDDRFLRLAAADNVVVALTDVDAGTSIAEFGITAQDSVPAGHKIASSRIEAGAAVLKYGQQIGVAVEEILQGSHVHTQNVQATDFKRDAVHANPQVTAATAAVSRTFEGIQRADGRAATRNYLGIVTSVNCSASVATYIADSLRGGEIEQFGNVDGIVPITHGHGCCQAADSEGIIQLRRTLSGFCNHPNFAGVLVLGLGCETNQIASLLDSAGLHQTERLRTMTIQDTGGTRATIDKGRQVLLEMLPAANAVTREPIPASELMLGLECGGSDGYSGISANPALGRASDLLVQQGGTAILSETPEIYGAEHLLLARAADDEVATKLSELIEWWEQYAAKNDASLDNNPSPGNKAGGLTTIYEKSLGAVAKGGASPLNGVFRYAERIDRKGLVFMDSPGYDPMSITGQVAAGANLVAFTTGRGSVYGCKPVPSVKIATNTAMYERMQEDMDVNGGRIIDGETTIEKAGEEIFELLLQIASGKKTKSEILGFGDNEFVPWIFGAQM
jgi:altronate hydrolase